MTRAPSITDIAPETTSRVYRYCVYWDVASIAVLKSYLAVANAMYNELAAATNTLLAEREAIITRAHPEHARLQDELSYVDRKRNPNFSGRQRVEICKRLRELIKSEKVARDVYREADAYVSTGWKRVRAEVNRSYRDRLCWTHRGLVDRAVETAAKGRKIEGARTPVRTWGYRIRLRDGDDDTGLLGGQTFVSDGCRAREVFDFGSARQRVVQIGSGKFVPLPEGRSARRGAARMPIAFRIAEGVYLRGQILMHRDLPEEGMIKEIRISRAKVGRYQEHHIMFTVSSIPKPMLGHGVAAHHVGWSSAEADEDDPARLTAGAIATEHGTMLLHPRGIDGLDLCERLQADTDKRLDLLRDTLWAELSALPEIPEHLVYLRQWRSPERLMALVDDETLTPEQRARVAAWRYHHRHRVDAIENARRNAIATRDQHYRSVIRDLVRQGIGTLVIERAVLERMSRREKGEDGKRWQKQRARVAISSFRLFAASAGLQVVEVDPAYTSQCCSHCGAVHEESRQRREYVCVECGAVEHVDANAARILRSAFCERVHDEIPAVVARKPKKPSRSERFAEARRRAKVQDGGEAAE